MFRAMLKDGVHCKVMEVTVFISSMMVEVDEVLYVVMGANELNVFFCSCQSHSYHLTVTGGHKGFDRGAILGEVDKIG